MRGFLKRSLAAAVFVSASTVLVSTHTQAQEQGLIYTLVPGHTQLPEAVDLDITATFEYPAEVNEGDIFPVYVWITNNSDQSIEAPLPSYVLMRSDAGLIYISSFCRLHCVFADSRIIEPGGRVLIHMGDVYTNIPGSTESQLGYGDQFLGGYTNDGQRYIIDVEDVLPVTIVPAEQTGPGAEQPEIPSRQALELVESDKLVRDPNTGYEWLRFGESTGMTEQELQVRMQSGGDLHGFVIASRHQVQQLMLNHIYAAGVSPGSFPSPRFLLGRDGGIALTQFIELIQATREADNRLGVKGVVSDPIPLRDERREFATIEFSAAKTYGPYFNTAPKVVTQVLSEESLSDETESIGVWLVRGAETNRHLSSGIATYTDDYLFLPNVVIDGNHYRVEMFRKEGTNPSFVMTDIRAASAADLTQPAAVFDADSGSLSVNNVQIMSEWPAVEYDLVLEMVPETDPPLVNLVQVSASTN